MWFIGAEVEQETSAPPPKKHPGSAPEISKITHTPTGIYPFRRTRHGDHIRCTLNV